MLKALQAESQKNSLQLNPWPMFSEEEIEKTREILASGKVNYWTGEEGKLFEQEYAKSINVKYAVALMNGTVALEACLAALNIGPGDEVITTCRTFIASASCIVMRGATPVLADVDLQTQNITVESIRKVLTPKTKAIIVVHLAGWPCDMPEIMSFAKANHLAVIEDCAQAHGATIHGQAVGSFGDMAAFSFCQDKIITTAGEGGMVTTNDYDLWQTLWTLKDHGKHYDTVFKKDHPPGFRWLHESFGTNWRMTEIQAAVGRIQLRNLDKNLAERRRHAKTLEDLFYNYVGLRITPPPAHVSHAYYKYYVFVRPEQLRKPWTRDNILQSLMAENIPCFTGVCPEIYLEKAFKHSAFKQTQRFPNAAELGETSLMFLVHPSITEEQMLHVTSIMSKVLDQACS